jgi:lysophospholipase L1-like esterase
MSPLIVANKELLKPFIEKQQRKESSLLLALGDSNMDNTNFTRGGKQWPELLHTELKNHYETQGLLFLNSALSGNTVLDALKRFDTDIRPYKPSLTLFCLGSNDRRLTPDVFEKGFHECIDRLEEVGSSVFVSTPAPIMERKPEPAHIWKQDKELGRNVEIIRKIVSTRKVTFVDFYQKVRAMEDEEKLEIQSIMADEVHLNAAGHQLAFRIFAPVFDLPPTFAWEKEQSKA